MEHSNLKYSYRLDKRSLEDKVKRDNGSESDSDSLDDFLGGEYQPPEVGAWNQVGGCRDCESKVDHENKVDNVVRLTYRIDRDKSKKEALPFKKSKTISAVKVFLSTRFVKPMRRMQQTRLRKKQTAWRKPGTTSNSEVSITSHSESDAEDEPQETKQLREKKQKGLVKWLLSSKAQRGREQSAFPTKLRKRKGKKIKKYDYCGVDVTQSSFDTHNVSSKSPWNGCEKTTVCLLTQHNSKLSFSP